jgi:hypothetical protein
MGDLRPDNGGPPADDGGGAQPRGLPNLPPEWGTIVIPDDAAELDHEAEALRRELHASFRRAKIRKRLGLGGDENSLGIPVVIMTVAILTTLISLLVVTWGNQPNGGYPAIGGERTTSITKNGATGPAPDMHTPLNDLTFANSLGDKVRMGTLLPMIVLLVDGCDCQRLITGVANAVPKGVRVVPVASSATMPAGDPANVVRLADPAGTLRARFGDGTSDGTATAVVVSSGGKVVVTVPHAASAADIKPLNPG